MNTKLNNEFYVVRHGRAENNDKHVVSCKLETQQTFGLSEEGHAAITSEAEQYKNFDVIYTSPFRRTLETAELFAETSQCDVLEDERLKEFDTGNLDMKPSEEFSAAMKEHKEIDYTFEGGESFLDVSKRLTELINEANANHQNKKILMVTHGVPAEILVDLFKDVPLKKWEKCIDKGKVFSLQA